MFRKTMLHAAAATALALLTNVAVAEQILDEIDADHDGTVDIVEAESRGRDVFRGLDADRDGVLSSAELAHHVDEKSITDYDNNSSKTLDRSEYAQAIGIEFRNADTNSDSKLDADELRSPTAAKLLQLLR